MIIKKICRPLACAAAIAIITANAQQVMLFVKSALALCYNNIIPSLFVFMVFSSYLGQSRFTGILSLPLMWYSYLMKIKDKRFSAYILLSFIGGFAVGAGFLEEMKQSGYENNCLKSISPVMINNSFSFCVFAVGIGLLDNYYLGCMLFAALASASLITAFILSFIFKYNIVAQQNSSEQSGKSFVDCVNNSVKSILSICGYVIIFYVICKVLKLYISSEIPINILSALLEVTAGCTEIARNTGKNPFFICIVLSLMPVSTLCQVYHFTHSTDIIRTLMISRVIHTPVSLMIFTMLCNLFPVAAGALSPESMAVKYFYNSFEISAVLFMLILSFTVISDRNRLFTKPEK
ncbi:MAG: hypothetical protein IJ410_02910 [Oscillospiraceae bacterium]|nr:hypothetical protein [Oscillospiraceae bacterium]